jgi:hypothetical protein
MVMVIALAAVGIGYGLWAETLYLDGEVYTGTVDIEFSGPYIEEGVDVNGQYTTPPPAGKDTVLCEAFLGGPDGDSEVDFGYDQMTILVEGLFPSYHCKVGFDVTNIGTVPVHVHHPNCYVPPWVFIDYSDCYEHGFQLHPGESTPWCWIDIHFTNDDGVPEGSGPYFFDLQVLAEQWNEATAP